MRSTNTESFACPHCRSRLRLIALEAFANPGDGPERVRFGSLECDGCGRVVPVCEGFPLFTESVQAGPLDSDALRAISARCFGDAERMLAFVRGKSRRPARDRYAAFQPFNESTRAFLPLVPLLREGLAPGDRILDLWCRTGWSGELLAALFPEQRVVSVWEGASDVLGYRGFGFWLGERQRAANLDVLFASVNEPLPFEDDAIALVHGLDTLHRYDQAVLIPETLRVCTGAVIFPHVHLTNSEPSPYFDRGELQLHGRSYRERIERLLRDSGRSACVMSERDLHDLPDGLRLEDDAETRHYNALIAIVPDELLGRPLHPESPADPSDPDLRPIPNPLLATDLHSGRISLAESPEDEFTQTLLARHPLQAEILRRAESHTLDRCESELLFAASQCRTLGESAAASGRNLSEVAAAAHRLAELRIIELRAVSEAMARLQQYYAQQRYLAPAEEQTIARLFESACERYGTRPLVIADEDGSCFRYADAAQVVGALADRLQRAGVEPGDRVCIHATASPETLFTFWACALVGAIFVPLAPGRSAHSLQPVAEAVRPRILMLDRPRLAAAEWPLSTEIVVFDDESSADIAGHPRLSEWIAANTDAPRPVRPTIAPDDPAAILHTSGTTGRPKPVLLSHAALYRSGDVLARACAWNPDDIVLTPGDLHAMTGLRNPGVAALHAGASVVTAPEAERAQPLAVADLIDRRATTVLCTVPAVLRTLARHADRLPPRALRSLRQVLSTGCRLPTSTSESFRKRFGIEPFDYYGATETCGISTGTVRMPEDVGPAGVGRPLDCIARIVADDGRTLPPNERGEILIFSNRLMLGYPGDDADGDTGIRGGWYHTGDLAVRDDSGRIHLVGRRRDFIKSVAGERVSRAEIESVLKSAPGVLDAAVGVHESDDGDEETTAYVVPADPSIDGIDFCERLRRFAVEQLGAQAAPRRIESTPALDAMLKRDASDEDESGPGTPP